MSLPREWTPNYSSSAATSGSRTPGGPGRPPYMSPGAAAHVSPRPRTSIPGAEAKHLDENMNKPFVHRRSGSAHIGSGDIPPEFGQGPGSCYSSFSSASSSTNSSSSTLNVASSSSSVSSATFPFPMLDGSRFSVQSAPPAPAPDEIGEAEALEAESDVLNSLDALKIGSESAALDLLAMLHDSVEPRAALGGLSGGSSHKGLQRRPASAIVTDARGSNGPPDEEDEDDDDDDEEENQLTVTSMGGRALLLGSRGARFAFSTTESLPRGFKQDVRTIQLKDAPLGDTLKVKESGPRDDIDARPRVSPEAGSTTPEDEDNLLTLSSVTARPLIAKAAELRKEKQNELKGFSRFRRRKDASKGGGKTGEEKRKEQKRKRRKKRKKRRRQREEAEEDEDGMDWDGFRAPDGGYGWAVVIGAFLVQFWVAGLFKSYGVLFVAVMAAFKDSSAAVASWIPAILSTLCLALAPLTSILCQRFTCRSVVFVGGLFCSAGLILSYFATSLLHLFFSFGILTGIGGGLSTTPGVILVSRYFDRHRALANGITVSGTAAGGLLFPWLIDQLVYSHGFQGAFLLLGACTLHVCVGAALYRPLSVHMRIQAADDAKDRALMIAAEASRRSEEAARGSMDSNMRKASTKSDVLILGTAARVASTKEGPPAKEAAGNRPPAPPPRPLPPALMELRRSTPQSISAKELGKALARRAEGKRSVSESAASDRFSSWNNADGVKDRDLHSLAEVTASLELMDDSSRQQDSIRQLSSSLPPHVGNSIRPVDTHKKHHHHHHHHHHHKHHHRHRHRSAQRQNAADPSTVVLLKRTVKSNKGSAVSSALSLSAVFQGQRKRLQDEEIGIRSNDHLDDGDDEGERDDAIGEMLRVRRPASVRSSSLLHSVEDLSTDSTCVYKDSSRGSIHGIERGGSWRRKGGLGDSILRSFRTALPEKRRLHSRGQCGRAGRWCGAPECGTWDCEQTNLPNGEPCHRGDRIGSLRTAEENKKTAVQARGSLPDARTLKLSTSVSNNTCKEEEEEEEEAEENKRSADADEGTRRSSQAERSIGKPSITSMSENETAAAAAVAAASGIAARKSVDSMEKGAAADIEDKFPSNENEEKTKVKPETPRKEKEVEGSKKEEEKKEACTPRPSMTESLFLSENKNGINNLSPFGSEPVINIDLHRPNARRAGTLDNQTFIPESLRSEILNAGALEKNHATPSDTSEQKLQALSVNSQNIKQMKQVSGTPKKEPETLSAPNGFLASNNTNVTPIAKITEGMTEIGQGGEQMFHRKSLVSMASSTDSSSGGTGTSSVASTGGCCAYLDLTLLRDPKFLAMGTSVALMSAGCPYALYFLPAHAASAGRSRTEGNWLVSISALLDLVGRLSCGALADLHLFERRKGYIGSILGAGMAVLLLPLATAKGGFGAAACLSGAYGLCLGAWFLLVPVLLADQHGTRNISSSYGLVRLFQSFSAISVPPFAGFLRDVTGSYEACFYFMGTCMVLGGIIMIVQPMATQWCCGDEPSPKGNPSMKKGALNQLHSLEKSRNQTDTTLMRD